MKAKHLLALLAGLAISATASAAPTFSLAGGYTGPVTIKFSNWENIVKPDGSPCTPIAVDCKTYGILDVTQVLNPLNNAVLWNKGDGGAYLNGVFNGLTVSSVGAGSPFNVNSTGGVAKIYLSDIAITAGLGTAGYVGGVGGLGYTSINQEGQTLFLDLTYDMGCNAAGETVCGTFNSATTPFSGAVVSSYLSVTGLGSHDSKFNTDSQTNGLGGQSDFFAQNTFCPNGSAQCGGPIGDWQLLSQDPIRGAVIPEPASLGLVGLALAVAGFARRRRKS